MNESTDWCQKITALIAVTQDQARKDALLAMKQAAGCAPPTGDSGNNGPPPKQN